MTVTLTPGELIQTIFYDLDPDICFDDEEDEELIDFCVDTRLQVRKGTGFVNMGGDECEFHPDYVPSERWGISHSRYISHSTYVEIELPCESELMAKVREVFMKELQRRLDYLSVRAKERIAKENSPEEDEE